MDIDSILNIIVPHLPDAHVGEDDHGELVIMTGLKARKEPPPNPPSVLNSNWYLQPCIRLAHYCADKGINLDQAWAAIQDSGISFGRNDDTLVREERLCRLLGIEPPEHEWYMISIGC